MKRGPSISDRLLYGLECLVLGQRGADFRRTKRWIYLFANQQATSWDTSVEAFRREYFDPVILKEKTGLTDNQVTDYSHRNKVDVGIVAVMQKLVSQFALSRGDGKSGSRVWAPAMIALALSGLDRSPRERDWRFLLVAALCELIRQRGAPGVKWDIRIALDAAYIVMLYLRLLPNADIARQFAATIRDELIQLRLDEAENHLLKTLLWM